MDRFDWMILKQIERGTKVVENKSGLGKTFTLGKRGRTHYNSNILDDLANQGYLDRRTNTITAQGLLALIWHTR